MTVRQWRRANVSASEHGCDDGASSQNRTETTDISVVLCTYNRAAILPGALTCLAAMKVADDLRWEIVVVDNNSDDLTHTVVKEFSSVSPVPVRYAFERKQGLSHARQLGVSLARGDIIAFTDDDVAVDVAWLNELWTAFTSTDAVCVGGPILPKWEAEPPDWLVEDLHGALALLELGEQVRVLDVPRLWGANMAFRASVFQRHGGFDSELGRTADKLYAGEETDLMRRILCAGGKLVYYPSARVTHFVPATRLRKGYFRRWRFHQGELKARSALIDRDRQFARVPLHMWRYVIFATYAWFFRRLSFNREAFLYELDLIEFAGYFLSRWQARSRGAR